MSEIEKMYENAGVKKINTHQSEIDNGDPRFTGISHSDSYIKYPSFTAEKQIELIKWLIDTDYYITEFCRLIDTREYYIETNYKHFQSNSFEESLAGVINKLYADMSEEEKQQVKGILE